MPDLVKRAREYARNLGGPPEDYLVWQLADEIERLLEVEKLYEAGVASWNPVYKIVLDERDALRREIERLQKRIGVLEEALTQQINTEFGKCPP